MSTQYNVGVAQGNSSYLIGGNGGVYNVVNSGSNRRNDKIMTSQNIPNQNELRAMPFVPQRKMSGFTSSRGVY